MEVGLMVASLMETSLKEIGLKRQQQKEDRCFGPAEGPTTENETETHKVAAASQNQPAPSGAPPGQKNVKQ